MTTEEKKTPERTQPQLEAEIAVTRVEMVHTINVLADRLKPKALAENASASAKLAAADTAALLTGEGMPAEKNQARNVKVMLGVGVTVLAGVALIVLRSRRK